MEQLNQQDLKMLEEYKQKTTQLSQRFKEIDRVAKQIVLERKQQLIRLEGK